MRRFMILLVSAAIFTACTKDLGGDIQEISNSEQTTNSCEIAFPNAEKERIEMPSGTVLHKVDSVYILEGDILLTEEQAAMIGSGGTRSLGTGKTNLWPNRTVYYQIAPGFPYAQRIYDAIAHWEANTQLRFVNAIPPVHYYISEFTDWKGDVDRIETPYYPYIRFVDGDGCSSYIGMQRFLGGQPITVGFGCNTGSVIHEIGHAIGLVHEHSRSDRDQYITIYPDRIQPAYLQEFDKREGWKIGSFDFNSAMLYSTTEFQKPGETRPVMTKKNGTTWVTQRTLSAGDIATVKALYGPRYAKVNRRLKDREFIPKTFTMIETYSNELNFYTDATYSVEYNAFNRPDGGKSVRVKLMKEIGRLYSNLPKSTQLSVEEIHASPHDMSSGVKLGDTYRREEMSTYTETYYVVDYYY